MATTICHASAPPLWVTFAIGPDARITGAGPSQGRLSSSALYSAVVSGSEASAYVWLCPRPEASPAVRRGWPGGGRHAAGSVGLGAGWGGQRVGGNR
jgi:hypothetical protein